MNYRIYEVEEDEKEALAELRIAAMRPSLEAVGRFDPDRARSRFLNNFCREATRKVEVDERLARISHRLSPILSDWAHDRHTGSASAMIA
jgi:hypothetical protein